MLVTGAAGFIGRAVCARLSETPDIELVATVRRFGGAPLPVAAVSARELSEDSDWRDVLESVDVVVHAAARAHVTNGRDDLAEYRRVNVAGTMNLARQAAACGVRRLVFLSSVKVNGDSTLPGHGFSAEDRPAPVDAYAVSKHEAEIGLVRMANESGMEIVTIRPPLVYGPGVKANFLTLMRWVHRGYPLPFARVYNARSLIAVQNLVDLIRVCCMHPAAANQTFMATDGEDVSIAELVRRLGTALKRPARLVALPPPLVLTLATLVGKRRQAETLLGNLQVDAGRTRERLGWQPVVDMRQALQSTARHYLEGLR